MRPEALPVEWFEGPAESVSILVVDDNSALGELAAEIIRARTRAETVAVESADAALRLFEAQPTRWAALVTDFHMPGMTGHDLALRLRELRPELPVVIVSGAATMEQGCEGIGGRVEFVQKPFTGNTLTDAIASVTSSR